MADAIEGRIERLLDQLERPDLNDSEIEQIKEKIRFLREQQS
jgi:hypothetical protein